ncbi:MAG: prepilin-type N-terminal cleavage/methylation domain-containing protein [Candidatus Gracilibacteria bacterium]|nr:prepilin-type N-terminal cleavage/methylation domain-containing protein [Candidatus Gracilibacteria bacterium]
MKKSIIHKFNQLSKSKTKAFTLVELIVTITILSILGTIAFISFQGYSKSSRDSVRISDIKNVENGLELFSVKSGKYPDPDSSTILIGGTDEIKQGILGENVIRTIDINKIPLDPKTGRNYIYSVFGDGQYYQIAYEKENLTTSILKNVNAEETEVVVKGNYDFDPTLPSLIIIKDSVGSEGIYASGVCFITNLGENKLDSKSGSCLKKENMVLKNYDNGLLGYWNFDEIGFIDNDNVYGGTTFFKDYSGNNYNAFNSGAYLGTGYIAPIQTGGYLGKGIYFERGALYLGGIEEYMLYPYKTFSISLIANLYDYKNPYPYLINSYHSTFNISCHDYPICNGQYNTEYLGYQLISKNQSGAIIVAQRGYVPGNVIPTNKFFIYTFTYDGINLKTFVNGILKGSIQNKVYNYTYYDISGTRLDRVVRLGGGSNNLRDFYGVIDDVKIYNRTLSEKEVLQQAKIAGF